MYALNTTQMGNGEFYQSSLWNTVLPSTRRRIVGITYGTSSITFNFVISATSPKNPFAATSSTQTDKLKITGVSGLNGTYPVATVGTNSVTIRASSTMLASKPFTFGLESMATRVTSSGGDKPETRYLGNFKYNWNLGSTTQMHPMQNQVRDILYKFWTDPEIVHEWKFRHQANKNSWDSLIGPTWADFGNKLFDRDTMLHWWMSTVHAASQWKASAIDSGKTYAKYMTKLEATGVKNLGNWITNPFQDWPTADLQIGLWQMSSMAAFPFGAVGYLGFKWWQSVLDFAQKFDHNDISTICSREYNTRAALHVIFNTLFLTNDKPFIYWPSSDKNDELNTKFLDCYNQSKTNFNYKTIGGTAVVCEDWKK